MCYSKVKQQGFTLVEIAIVLVIIGLLLGTVFKGQELVEQAKVKNFIKKTDEIRAATYLFLDKYDQLPGDASGLSAFGISDAVNPGDGVVSNADFWRQLRQANLIGGRSGLQQQVKTPYGTNFNAGNGKAGFTNANVICAYIPGEIAQQIDTKYDDGNGLTGTYRGAGTSFNAIDNNAQSYDSTQFNWICTKL